MKDHIVIKMQHPIPLNLPYWEAILDHKNSAPQSILPAIDTIFQQHRLSFWATLNYQPASSQWTPDEITQGFNRIYRLILQQNRIIPTELISSIRVLPGIEYVSHTGVAGVQLPESQLTEARGLSINYRDNSTFLEEAHKITRGSPAIKIAVLDTGVHTGHPELQNAILPGKDFVDIINGATDFIGDYLGMDDLPEDNEVGHGTHVAGIIAGSGIRMPIGVAPNCKIIPVRVLGALKRGNSVVGAGLIDNINDGIKWAVDQGADVINMSLGIKHTGGGLPHAEVIQYALDKGVTVVAASGNDGTEDKYYPGALPGVIAVGAADDQGNLATFSTYGGHVSLTAPGVNIFSSFLNRGYAVSSGTSQAAPFVSGGIALLKSYAHSMNKALNDNQIKYLLKHTSDKNSRRFKDEKAGYGNLNLLDALKLLQYKI